nr:amino acid adenylation domain-containing protein [Acidobacteriota bacterium]
SSAPALDRSFFELGGHSLLATRVIARVNAAFGTDFVVRELFAAPTIAALAQKIDAAAPGPGLPPLTPRDRNAGIAMSSVQRRLWFLDKLAPGSAYNIALTLDVEGELDPHLWKRAFQNVCERHEVLRTRFAEEDGEPTIVLMEPFHVDLTMADLCGASSENVREAVQAEADRPFNLAEGPLVRGRLLKIAERHHLFCLTLHHAVGDGWSLGVFIRDLTHYYLAARDGKPEPAPLTVQYADYAAWQSTVLQQEATQTAMTYWKEKLGGNLPVLRLPTDGTGQKRGDLMRKTLSPDLVRCLEQIAANRNASLFHLMLAAFQLQLGRLAGAEDIIVGAPLAGRPLPETEEMIGCFINPMPLRTDLTGNPSFIALMDRVRETALDAQEYGIVPFEKLVEEIRPQRDLDRHPFFDVEFNMVNVPLPSMQLPGLQLKPLQREEGEAHTALSLYAFSTGEDLELTLVYRRGMFSAERAESMLRQFAWLLEQVAEDAELPLDRCSLLDPQARQTLPNPAEPIPAPEYPDVCRRFQLMTETHPAATAVIHDNAQYTYAEIAARSEAVLAGLLEHGLKPGDVVGVYGGRCRDLVPACLAVLRGRGVLLLLDPTLPEERIAAMMQDANTAHLLVIEGTPPDALTDVTTPIFTQTLKPATVQAPPPPESDDPAYIFFTSGSTGRPKGVLGCHKGLAHFVDRQGSTFDLKPGKRVAQLAALSFDACLREILVPLCHGAAVCIPAEHETATSERLLTWLQSLRVNLIHAVPSVVAGWLEQVPENLTLQDLETLILVGEPLTDGLVEKWRKTFPAAGNLVNYYGTTENTLAQFAYPVPEKLKPGVQPCGWGIGRNQGIILNTSGRRCGIGEPGEVLIRSPFRTLGYLDRRQATFEQNSFRQDPDDRWHRTGDLGRYAPDGCLEIMGRTDHQIKLRGVRIEPAEIEAALAGFVDRSVVTLFHDESGAKYLVAYIVGREQPTAAELRQKLRRLLTDVMIPGRFLFLDDLPTLPNGKIDRTALPSPKEARPDTDYVAPRTESEQLVTRLWQEVLGRDRIGVNDDFFELGGHSLLAIRVLARIETQLGVTPSAADLFRNPTAGALAAHLDELRARKMNWSAPDEEALEDEEELTF